jgi:ABC-type glycerol-3-phosphate transport system substrate-binding protein
MLYLANWYTNRAFQAESSGGQPADFRFGLMKAPLMDGAASPNAMEGQFSTAYAVVSSSEHADIAADILRFWAQPEYGARMSLMLHYPSAFKWGPDDIPEDLLTMENPYKWYDEMVADVYGDTVLGIHEIPCADFEDALTSVLNEGFNLGLMTIDEAIEYLDAHLCK